MYERNFYQIKSISISRTNKFEFDWSTIFRRGLRWGSSGLF